LIQTARLTRIRNFVETKPSVLLLRPKNGFQRFHTASVIRDLVERVASPAMSAMPPIATEFRVAAK
jgi:hypothetical protein